MGPGWTGFSVLWPICALLDGTVAGGKVDPEAAVACFEQRVAAVFQTESGEPLERVAKQPPLRPGRGNYTRACSCSIVRFAARCFHLGEMLDEANAALVENARHYLDNPKDIIDRDSFHWHADVVMRLIDMYGTNGSVHPGGLTPETEEVCRKPIWINVRTSSRHYKPDHAKTATWEFHSTENHHAMDFSLQWHFAKLAKDRPEYREQKLDDGSSLEDHYRAWSDYIVVDCRGLAKKGVCIEIMCPGYNAVWLKGFYNFRDFGEPESPEIKGFAGRPLRGRSGERIRGGDWHSSPLTSPPRSPGALTDCPTAIASATMQRQLLLCLMPFALSHCVVVEENPQSTGTATQLPGAVPGFSQPLTAISGQGSVTIREGSRTLCSFRTASPNVEQTRWHSEQEQIVVKSRGNHGPATVQLFDSRTGRELGRVMAYEAANGPAWARPMAE